MKKSISLVLAVILLFSSFGIVWAQTSIGPPNLIWERTTSTQYAIYSFTVLPGNRYVTGQLNYYSQDNKIVCYDSSGNIIWQKALWNKIFMNGMITLESENAFVAMLADTVYKFDYEGNLLSSLRVPTSSNNSSYFFLYIFKSSEYYAVIESSGENPALFLYDHAWNLLRSFPVKGDVGSAVIRDNEIYIASSYAAYGVYSNGSSRLSKYNLLTGAEIFSLFFPDLFSSRLCLSNNNEIYFASFRLAPEAPQQFWEVKKVSASGNILWSKNWLGDLPGQPILGLWVKNIVSLGNEGCLVIGAATKLNQGTNFDVNNQDPTMIAFRQDGEINWKYRQVNRNGRFFAINFDYNKNLIVTGLNYVGGPKDFFMKFSLPGLTALKETASEVPIGFSLLQNYPNPFNPTTTINFSANKSSFVSLRVYDLLGKEVAVLVAEELVSGNYQYTFLANDNLPSGVYLYRLEAGNYVQTRKMLFLK